MSFIQRGDRVLGTAGQKVHEEEYDKEGGHNPDTGGRVGGRGMSIGSLGVEKR